MIFIGFYYYNKILKLRHPFRVLKRHLKSDFVVIYPNWGDVYSRALFNLVDYYRMNSSAYKVKLTNFTIEIRCSHLSVTVTSH